jgi:hypothetical protein
MCFMVMDKMVAMKLVSPLTLVRYLLSDYERCRRQSDVVRISVANTIYTILSIIYLFSRTMSVVARKAMW